MPMSSTFQIQNSNMSLKDLPHNIEAEQGIIGAILLNTEIYIDISDI